jgi:hypothetical protein
LSILIVRFDGVMSRGLARSIKQPPRILEKAEALSKHLAPTFARDYLSRGSRQLTMKLSKTRSARV